MCVGLRESLACVSAVYKFQFKWPCVIISWQIPKWHIKHRLAPPRGKKKKRKKSLLGVSRAVGVCLCVCGGGYGSIRAKDRLCFLLPFSSAVGILCLCVSLCVKERKIIERNLVMLV